MKHEKYASPETTIRFVFVAALSLSAGCAGWTATPERLQADYGASVHTLVNNQIYDTEKYQHPGVLAPDGMDGIKAESVLQDTYRNVTGKPEEVRKRVSAASSGGASSGGGTSP